MDLLQARSDSASNHTCPTQPLAVTKTAPIAGPYTFHDLSTIICSAAVALTCVSTLILVADHATHLGRPNEQLKIMRICLLVPVYGILCLASAIVPATYVYLRPWTDLAVALALGNFLLLMCQLVLPDDVGSDVFLAALRKGRWEQEAKQGGGGAREGLTWWFRVRWVAAFQYIPVSLLIAGLACITQAADKYCLTSSEPYFAHLWLSLTHNLSLIAAAASILTFFLTTLRPRHRPYAKLLALALLVVPSFAIQIIFWILDDTAHQVSASPSSPLSHADRAVGLPLLAACILTVPCAVLLHWAYGAAPYRSHHHRRVLGKWWRVCDPSEIVSAVLFAFPFGSWVHGSSNGGPGDRDVSGLGIYAQDEQQQASPPVDSNETSQSGSSGYGIHLPPPYEGRQI